MRFTVRINGHVFATFPEDRCVVGQVVKIDGQEFEISSVTIDPQNHVFDCEATPKVTRIHGSAQPATTKASPRRGRRKAPRD